METTAPKTNTTTTAAETPTKEPENWSEMHQHVLAQIAATSNVQPTFHASAASAQRGVEASHSLQFPNYPPLSKSVNSCSLAGRATTSSSVKATSSFSLLPPLTILPLLSTVAGLPNAKVVKLGKSPNLYRFLNPLTIEGYFIATPPVAGEINLRDCRILELAKPMTLVGGPNGPYEYDAEGLSEKVVGGLEPGSAHMFSVLIQLHNGALIFWRTRDKAFIKFEPSFDGGILHVFDIAYYKRKYYAFPFLEWKVGVIDPAKPGPVTMDMNINGPSIVGGVVGGAFTVLVDGVKYALKNVSFVVSYDESKLYLVIEATNFNPRKGMIFVYVLTKEKKWDRVRNLDDEILFIGFDVSFSMPLSNLPQWHPGSICLFTRPFPMTYIEYGKREGGRGLEMPEGTESLTWIDFFDYPKYYRMFVMDDGSSVEENNGIVPFKMLTHMEKYSALFFPPPGWVKWTCPTVDNGVVKFDKLKFPDDLEVLEGILKGLTVAQQDEFMALLNAELLKMYDYSLY